jgi:radical SAM superfamily enzyme YgiQ (UPF0313 family)
LRVLLINTNRKRDFLAAPPLGICYVAQAAEAAGHEVRVLDLCFSGRSAEREIKRTISSFMPEVIGLSVRNIDNVNMIHPVYYLPEIAELSRAIRRQTRVPLVVGGSGASLMPENVLKALDADYLVVSDGEDSFVELLACLEQGREARDVPGVGMMVEGEFHLTKPRLADFQSPAPDLGRWIDMASYQRIGGSYNIQTKRGCRHRCIYCTYNQALEGNRLRLRPPVEVVDEVEEALFKYRPTSFEFVDSVFNDPVEHSMEIMEEIIRRPWKADFTTMGMKPRNLDYNYLQLMWKAGFRSFMITPESASDTMLENYKKGFSRDDVVRAAEAINRTSFATWWFFMIGGPGETNQTLQESLDFALEHLRRKGRPVSHVAQFFLGVRLYPGTGLWDIALKKEMVSASADPLQPLWYVSEALDLDLAVHQMTTAASRCPEVYLGFDERVLIFSRPAAFFFKLLGYPPPYWRYMPSTNRFGLRTRTRFMFKPRDIAEMVRSALKRQGYDHDPARRKFFPQDG